jgi:FkbH-like protein
MSSIAVRERYLDMLQRGDALAEAPGDQPEMRIAVLADHASQQLCRLLRAALHERGFAPHVYEGEYATAALTVHDADSDLYGFRPHFAFLSYAVQKYRARFFEATPEERERLPEDYLAEIMSVADALAGRGIGVIVSNFALPIERMFGNFGAVTRQSLYGSVLAFNALLLEALGRRKGCMLNDVAYIAARAGGDAFFDERLWASAKYLCANRFLPEVAHSVAAVAAALKGRITKVIVLDLDNTLWGGVIGDDGMDGIRLGGDAEGEAFQIFQRYLLSLKDRGYVLAVCSKNNHDTAIEVFRDHSEMILREDDVAVFVANWNDKASNIEYIARVLNLGLDSVVFVDDSPFERDLVRQALPAVSAPEMPEDVAEYAAALERSGLFESAGYSSADRTRNQMYREEAQRTTEAVKYGSIDDYLSSLDMRVQCGPFTAAEMPRVAQLIQRSNQFNLCTRRFSEADCTRFASEPDRYPTLQVRLRDRFGDYGLIAVVCCEVDGDELAVTEYVMSCRVLKRGVEAYIMNRLFDICRVHGLRAVRGEYIPTAKNAMVKDFWRDFDFRPVDCTEGRQVWTLPVADYTDIPNFLGETN